MFLSLCVLSPPLIPTHWHDMFVRRTIATAISQTMSAGYLLAGAETQRG
jgi:hypothetical protein